MHDFPKVATSRLGFLLNQTVPLPRLRIRCALVWVSFCCLAGLSTFCVADEPQIRDRPVALVSPEEVSDQQSSFFENSVRPILADHCLKCHGRERQEGGLRLDTLDGLTSGGDSGPALETEDLGASLLLSAIRYEDYEMPPSGPLPEAKLQVLQQWLGDGAPWPSHADKGGLQLRTEKRITDEDRNYWAFKPLEQVDTPESEQGNGSPIDAFIQRQLSEHSLNLAAPADKRTLLRRVYLDLIGVPPTIDETREFLEDESPDAYPGLVDRLLDDPRYGEKWARHWLDLVRYAESDGYNLDSDRPTAYLYRDWVIRSLNRDMPYDQFVTAQLAGDEIAPDNADMLAATGYLRNWIYEYNQRDLRTQWDTVLNDITDVTGEVFFGLGVGCARCHDHKFDPILQRDYYRLRASFADFIPRDEHLYGSPEQLAEYQRKLEKWQSVTEEIRAKIAELEQPHRDKAEKDALGIFPLDTLPTLFKSHEERDAYERQLYDFAHRQVIVAWDKLDFKKLLKDEQLGQWQDLQTELAKYDELKPKRPPHILAAGTVSVPPPPMHIPPNQDSDPVIPARFEVFGAAPLLGQREQQVVAIATQPTSAVRLTSTSTRDRASAESSASTSELDRLTELPRAPGRRTRLAEWINSPENPLPHRVIVNRIWQYHFGTGLVENASDFGLLGQPPTHPELLDWLAVWFLENDRSLKELHRLIVCSQTYQQTSQVPAEDAERASSIDPSNRWLWRYPARRLDAEQIRDLMLVSAGALEEKYGGPSAEHDSQVRSVYTRVKRNRPNPFLTTFDAPDGSGSVAKRQTTTTPNQSLLLTNAAWPLDMASRLASSLVASELGSRQALPSAHVEQAYLRCLQRSPSPEELQRALDFIRTTTQQLQSADEAAGTSNDPAEPSDAASQSAADKATWYETAQYERALADFCHVLFNSSEFLYLE